MTATNRCVKVWLTMIERTRGWFLWSLWPYAFTLGNKFIYRLGFSVFGAAVQGPA